MKKKYLFMLPAMSFAAGTSAFAQDVANIPAAAMVNMKADFSEAKPATEMFNTLADMLTNAAKESGQEIDGKAVLTALGLNEITSYAMSGEKAGDIWSNKMFIHNNGSDKGIFSLLGKKNQEFTVTGLAPADTDLAAQVELDLRTVEKLFLSVMKAANAPEDAVAEFTDAMAEEATLLGMTNSELLAKLNIRASIAITFDPAAKIPIPEIGEIDKPNFIIRIDGAALEIQTLLNGAVDMFGIPLQKKEENGVTSYSVPEALLGALMGYNPAITIDTNNNQVTIASSPDFLAQSLNAETPKLATSADFIKATEGLATKGNSMSYMSKDFAKLVVKLMEIAQAKGLLEGLDEAQDAEIMKQFENMKKIDQSTYSAYTRTDEGILMSEKGIQSLEKTIKEMQEQIKALIQEM